MRKAPARAVDSAAGPLRSIPSIERILSSDAFAPLVAGYGRDNVKRHVSDYLSILRRDRRPYDESQAAAAACDQLNAATASTLRPIINATGILIHTNLGRSPIDPSIWRAAGKLV